MDEDDDSPTTIGRQSQVRDQGNRGDPPQTRITKTGKVQELVATKGPKLPDAIRREGSDDD